MLRLCSVGSIDVASAWADVNCTECDAAYKYMSPGLRLRGGTALCDGEAGGCGLVALADFKSDACQAKRKRKGDGAGYSMSELE